MSGALSNAFCPMSMEKDIAKLLNFLRTGLTPANAVNNSKLIVNMPFGLPLQLSDGMEKARSATERSRLIHQICRNQSNQSTSAIVPRVLQLVHQPQDEVAVLVPPKYIRADVGLSRNMLDVLP